jgi:hypothetical protein
LNRPDQLKFHLGKAVENGVKKRGVDRGYHSSSVLLRLAERNDRRLAGQRVVRKNPIVTGRDVRLSPVWSATRILEEHSFPIPVIREQSRTCFYLSTCQNFRSYQTYRVPGASIETITSIHCAAPQENAADWPHLIERAQASRRPSGGSTTF